MNRTDKRTEFLSDVLVTAVEGGINYWASVSEYDPDAGTVRVHEWHPDTGETEDGYAKEGVLVTLDDIARGIGVLRRDDKLPLTGYWHDFWKADRTNGEDGDYDAGHADCVVQAAIFGEVVYG